MLLALKNTVIQIKNTRKEDRRKKDRSLRTQLCFQNFLYSLSHPYFNYLTGAARRKVAPIVHARVPHTVAPGPITIQKAQKYRSCRARKVISLNPQSSRVVRSLISMRVHDASCFFYTGSRALPTNVPLTHPPVYIYIHFTFMCY